MSLNTTNDASLIATTMSNYALNNGLADGSLLAVIANLIDQGFQQSIPTLLNVDITPPAGTLVFNQVNSIAMATEIGNACATYWASAVGFGIPESGTLNTITSVTNDASKIATPIANNIINLIGIGELIPPYYHFVDAIHKEVRTIIWDVIESGGNYTVNVA